MEEPLPENAGPNLNGHPPLSIAKVRSWFRDVDCTVADATALPIAGLINEYAFNGMLWRPEFHELRRNNASRKRNRRIAVELAKLKVDLRQMLDDVRRVVPRERHHQWQPGFDLLALVDQIMPYFDQHLPQRGREPDPWHTVARKIGAQIVDAFKASGIRRASLAKPTSPAVEVLRRALAYLGIRRSVETIVDAVRPKRTRKRRGKIRA